MSTEQALFVGGACGFLLGSLLLLILGLGIGLLKSGVEEAVREKLEIDNKEKKNG